ncbi:MAG TPA: YbhB/YbcL family Raf kinase inhibitor-like protein [Thermodesulfobacteriota bacterium]
MAFSLTSPAFVHDQPIPIRHTCDGEDLSPPLHWTDPPDRTQAFALVVDDPDAPSGTFTHWLLYDIPVGARELEEGIPNDEALPTQAKQGLNDFGNVGYGGPCPPPGPAHRYYFTLYALSRPANLAPRATKGTVLDAIRDHVLAQAQIMGRYQRAAGTAKGKARRA